MPQYGRWLVIAGVVATIGGCGGDNQPRGTKATSAPPAGAAAGESTAASTGTAAAQPISGKTWDVRMLGDATGYRFDPASITIKAGDGVRWTNVSGGPHNVTFWGDSIPQGAQQVLQGNMPQPIAPLTGPLLTQPSATYLISFGGAPKGLYKYYCTPHLAAGMKATITVQ